MRRRLVLLWLLNVGMAGVRAGDRRDVVYNVDIVVDGLVGCLSSTLPWKEWSFLGNG